MLALSAIQSDSFVGMFGKYSDTYAKVGLIMFAVRAESSLCEAF